MDSGPENTRTAPLERSSGAVRVLRGTQATRGAPPATPVNGVSTIDHQGSGIDLQLQVSQPTLEFLEETDVKAYVAETTEAVQIYNELAATQLVGGLFHSTC